MYENFSHHPSCIMRDLVCKKIILWAVGGSRRQFGGLLGGGGGWGFGFVGGVGALEGTTNKDCKVHGLCRERARI